MDNINLLNRKEIKANLKPCPFCGGRPHFEDHHRAFVNGESTLVSFIHCPLCNARSGRVPNSTNGSLWALNEAYKMWNSRI